MSCIPDMRDENNNYYQGYLNDSDAEYIAGYDYAVEDIFEEFMYNLDVYTNDFRDLGVDLDAFNNTFKDFIEKEYTDDAIDLKDISDTQIRLILTLFRTFQDYAEMKRDDMGASLIESMSDAEFEECKQRYKDGYKNVILRIEEAKEQGEL